MATLAVTRPHTALADTTRLRLLDLLTERPQSAKELAQAIGTEPDRLYYHLRKLTAAGLVRVAEHRQTADGKAERVYEVDAVVGRVAPDVTPEPAQQAAFLGAAIEATRLDLERLVGRGSSGQRHDLHAATAALTRTRLALAPAEFREFVARVCSLIDEYAQLPSTGPRRPVHVLFTAFERPSGARRD